MLERAEFIKSVHVVSQIPKLRLPEAVLCGRSNVGKSSFLNSFFHRKDLAQISSSPGKTRAINYYKVDDKYYFADLPGYGYAKVSKTEQERWKQLLQSFFSTSGHIAVALHFIDARHKPTELDVQLHEFFAFHGLRSLILMTKIDKVKQSELAKNTKTVLETFPEYKRNETMFHYSAKTRFGVKPVRKKIFELLEA